MQANQIFRTIIAILDSRTNINDHLRLAVGFLQGGMHSCDARVSSQFVVVWYGTWFTSETVWPQSPVFQHHHVMAMQKSIIAFLQTRATITGFSGQNVLTEQIIFLLFQKF